MTMTVDVVILFIIVVIIIIVFIITVIVFSSRIVAELKVKKRKKTQLPLLWLL